VKLDFPISEYLQKARTAVRFVVIDKSFPCLTTRDWGYTNTSRYLCMYAHPIYKFHHSATSFVGRIQEKNFTCERESYLLVRPFSDLGTTYYIGARAIPTQYVYR
jgi:hypothetical protein